MRCTTLTLLARYAVLPAPASAGVDAVARPNILFIISDDQARRTLGAYGKPYEGDTAWIPADIAEQTLPALFDRAGYDTFRSCNEGNSCHEAYKRFRTVKDKTSREGNAANGSAARDVLGETRRLETN